MPYLKVQPGTYSLTKRQMFQFDTCQFCGSGDFNLRLYPNPHHRNESQRGNVKDIYARRSCKDCGKTTALVKSKPD
jgi:ribosomal protein L37E